MNSIEVRRPYVPALTIALLCVVMVERAALREGVGWTDSNVAKVACVLAGLCCAVFLWALWRHGDLEPYGLLVIAAALIVSCLAATCALEVMDRKSDQLAHAPVSSVLLEIESDPTEGESGYRCRAKVVADGRHMGSVWLVTPTMHQRGSLLRCVGSYKPNQDDEWGEAARMQGIVGSVRVTRVLEERELEGLASLALHIRDGCVKALRPSESDERALLAGCLCGWKPDLRARGLTDLFAQTGTAHLVAVSGSHLSLVTTLAGRLLRRMRLRRSVALVLLVVTSGSFVLFCGMPVSAVRAWVMAVIAGVAGIAGRRSYGLSAASATALAMALANPCVSGDLGFALSVTSVCALCLFGPYATTAFGSLAEALPLPRRMPKSLRRRLRRAIDALVESISASLVASLATLPLVVAAFGRVSLVGPLANALLCLPFPLLMCLGVVSLPMLWVPCLGPCVLSVCDALAHVVLMVVGFAGHLPLACLPMRDWGAPTTVMAYVLLLIILVFWPRVSAKRVSLVLGTALVVFVTVVLRVRMGSPARICVLNVGQGDAILVQDGSATLLVDAGPDDSVVEALGRNGVFHLDAAVITHLHDDHYGGMQSLVGLVSCDRIYVGAGAKEHIPDELAQAAEALGGIPIDEVSYGDVLHVGAFSLRMVSPPRASPGTNNADSVQMDITYDKDNRTLCGLLTGDAEQEQLQEVLNRADIGDIDFLKVGHHGSAVSILPRQAVELDPEVSVASAGAHNRYGHPTTECVTALEDAGSLFLCTKDTGDVEVLPGEEGPVVHTQEVGDWIEWSHDPP